jgi:hypothetical protein
MASETCGIDYVDVSMVDRVFRWVRVYEPNGSVHEKQLRQEIPEEILMAAKSKRGELDGKVTVSAALADSMEFGNKAEAFVSISLSCENTVEACQELHNVIQPVVQRLVQEDLAMAAQLRDANLAARNQPGPVAAPPAPAGAPTLPRFVR